MKQIQEDQREKKKATNEVSVRDPRNRYEVISPNAEDSSRSAVDPKNKTTKIAVHPQQLKHTCTNKICEEKVQGSEEGH